MYSTTNLPLLNHQTTGEIVHGPQEQLNFVVFLNHWILDRSEVIFRDMLLDLYLKKTKIEGKNVHTPTLWKIC